MLVIVNVTIIVAALVLGFIKNREKVANEAMIFKLRRQLVAEKGEDKANFDEAWRVLDEADPAATVRVLKGAAQLARMHTGEPLQAEHLEDVEALMAEATAVEPAMHAATKRLVLEAGGRFKKGPLKKEARVVEKMGEFGIG